MSRRQSSHRHRRVVSAVLGAALAGGMLSAAPATAASSSSLVQIVSPADGAVINASAVPVTLQLLPGARPPTLLDFQDVTARFHRHGRTARAVLTPKDGLLDGNNVLTATVTGPGGSRSAEQVIFQANTGLVGSPEPIPPTFSLQTRVVNSAGGEATGQTFEVKVGDVPHVEPAIPAGWSCVGGVWVLTLDRASLDPTSSVDLPLCTDKQTAALGTYLAGRPATDMVIVNSISSTGGPTNRVKGLGDALSKIGAVKAEFNALGAGGFGHLTYSVEGIPGLPAGQAYQVGSDLGAENCPGRIADRGQHQRHPGPRQ